MSEGPRVARCDVCGDTIPVQSSQSGAIQPIRAGESCRCGAEEFRLLSEAEVDELVTEGQSGTWR